jgi:hypothetical protein
MTKPITIDLPHKLGAEEAKRRIAGGIGRLEHYVPGGADVRSSWTGNRLDLVVGAMGQEVNCSIDVQERIVRVEMLLPPLLAMFAGKIRDALTRRGTELLEDKRT